MLFKKLGKWLYALIVFCVIAAITLAVLPMFDWDIVALISWVVEHIWDFITRLGDRIANMPGFRAIFGK